MGQTRGVVSPGCRVLPEPEQAKTGVSGAKGTCSVPSPPVTKVTCSRNQLLDFHPQGGPYIYSNGNANRLQRPLVTQHSVLSGSRIWVFFASSQAVGRPSRQCSHTGQDPGRALRTSPSAPSPHAPGGRGGLGKKKTKVVGNFPKQIMVKTVLESVEYWPSYGPSKFPGIIWPKNLEKFQRFSKWDLGVGLMSPWSPAGPGHRGKISPQTTSAKKKNFLPRSA